MRITVNKLHRDDFIDAFIHGYWNMGIGITEKKTVYNTEFEITELKNSYRVTVKGKTKRFGNLSFVAEFLFDNCYDERYVYWPPVTPAQLNKMAKTMDRIYELRKAYVMQPIYKDIYEQKGAPLQVHINQQEAAQSSSCG
jgi:hypothetical protein